MSRALTTSAPHPAAVTRSRLMCGGMTIDFTDPGVIRDPYPALARLRAESAVSWHEPTGTWLAASHAAAGAVLRDRRLGRFWTDREPAEVWEPFNLLHRNQMMENEP